MEITKLPAIKAYYREFETTMEELPTLAMKAPYEVMENAQKDGFAVTGPQFWNYYWNEADPMGPFKLQICLPVNDNNQESSQHLATIEGFNCVSTVLEGPWSEIKKAYEDLMKEMAANNLKNGNFCREVYTIVDMENPENNVTEIYMSVV